VPPVFAFAGIWRPWNGTRKGETGEHRLFSFLTCEPNEVVRSIHAKAMPVVLADEEAWDVWLTGATEEALELQRPCPAARLLLTTPT
jgi:putative SOS response-associated peptidase YedK